MRIKTKFNKVISMILATIILISTIITPAFADGPDDNASGEKGNTSVAEGMGTYTYARTGYRMYFIDRDGNVVSNVVDFVNQEPTNRMPKGSYWCYGTKVGGFKYVTNHDELNDKSVYDRWIMSDVQAGFDSAWPLPMTNGTTPHAQGIEFREWFVRNQKLSGGSVAGSGGTGGTWNPVKPNPGSGSGSGSGESSEEQTAVSIEKLIITITKQMWKAYNQFKDYGASQAAEASVKAGMTAYNDIVASGVYNADQLAVLIQAINETAEEIVNQSLSDSGKNIEDGAATMMSLGDSLIFAYASEDSEIDIKDLNISKLISYKKDGNFIFQLKGITLSNDTEGNPNMVETACDKKLTLIVEPVYWLIPSYWEGGVRYEYDFWFYGTPTDYGRFCAAAGFVDSGNGRVNNYGGIINKTMARGFFLPEDLFTPDISDNVIIKAAPVDTITGAVPNTTLALNDIGFATHAYIFFGGEEVPEIPTYDTTVLDPNKDPHPVQDPDPHTGKIGLTDGENDKAYDPDPPDPANPGTGYRETSRTANIVKVYEKENPDGTREHVETFVTPYCPGTIHIQHEENYKVIGYFSSPELFGDNDYDGLVDSDCSEVPWIIFESSIFDKHYETELEWDTVKDKDGKTTEETVRISTHCDCSEDEDKPELGEHYYDTTLYVHLLYVPEIPETHTWDSHNYKDGQPAPAPDPLTDKECGEVEEDNPYLHFRIVKVYEEEQEDGSYEHLITYVRYPTVPIIEIEDEPVYKLIEWKTSEDFLGANTYTAWDDAAIAGVSPILSGSSPQKVDILDYLDIEKEATLYVRLRKPYKPEPTTSAKNEIHESQITKAISTYDKLDGSNWGSYWYKATSPRAKTIHDYGLCACYQARRTGTATRPDGSRYSYTYYEHIHDHKNIEHMTRQDKTAGDDDVFTTWTGLHDLMELETRKRKTAHDNYHHLVISGEKVGKTVTLDKYYNNDEYRVPDSEMIWIQNQEYTQETGIAYFTTIWRAVFDPNVTVAKYKHSEIDSQLLEEISTLHSSGNTPVGARMQERAKWFNAFKITLGVSALDNTVISACYDHVHSCCCCVIDPQTDVKNLSYEDSDGNSGTAIDFIGDFLVRAYAGKEKPVASAQIENQQNYMMKFSNGQSNKTRLFSEVAASNISFFPYIRMSHMVTIDSFSKWTEARYSSLKNSIGSSAQQQYLKERTLYVLSDKKSVILPSNSVEIGWFNLTQRNGKYGLQMTSPQWSTHQLATNGSEIWRQPNQVLPGGALYQLKTEGTETAIQSVTYSVLVEDSSRQWITVDNPNDYTVATIVKENNEYITELRNCLENFRIVQWVNKNYTLTNAWDNKSTAVKIVNGGESLSNLGLPNMANTDSKYIICNGTEDQSKAASEGDIDIMKLGYRTIVYKFFTDTEGNVYIATAQNNMTSDTLSESELSRLVNMLKPVCGTNKNAGSGVTLYKIGEKDDSNSEILSNLESDASLEHLNNLEVKTGFISNGLNSVTRNQGDDPTNAWVKDERWYNEAFDGIYIVQQNINYQIGLYVPNLRSWILDPALCPIKTSIGGDSASGSGISQGGFFTNAHISQFRLDEKSTYASAQGKEVGYVGTFFGMSVSLNDPENMFISRPFYIPNVNVQDLT